MRNQSTLQEPRVNTLVQLQMRQNHQQQLQQQQLSNLDEYFRSMNTQNMMPRNNITTGEVIPANHTNLDRNSRGLKVTNNGNSNKTWTDKQIVQ